MSAAMKPGVTRDDFAKAMGTFGRRRGGMASAIFSQLEQRLGAGDGKRTSGAGAAPRALEYTRKRKSLLGE